jgi:hypothetical protein
LGGERSSTPLCRASFATDAIHYGVPERHLQTFLGHRIVESTRSYARLAEDALLEVLPSPSARRRQAADKAPDDEAEQDQRLTGGPARTRTCRDGRKLK